MLKKMTFYCALLFLIPVFANAATYWSITASTSPASLKSNLIPQRPTNFGNYTTPNGGSLTNVTRDPYPSVNYVATVPIGFRLVNVKVDGVIKGTAAGTYRVEKGTSLSHNIVAYYTTSNFIITTYAAAGGTISLSMTAPAGSNPAISLKPATGYQLNGAIIDGKTYLLTDTLPQFVTKNGDLNGAVYTFPAVNAPHSIKGIFITRPSAKAVISTPSQSVPLGKTGITIDGSLSSSSVPGTIYDWKTTCGTITPSASNVKTAIYDATTNIESCTITLALLNTGISPDPKANVTITTFSEVLSVTNVCLSCHDGINGPAVTGFTTSPHYGKKSCADCHNPGNQLSHAYTPLKDMVNVCKNCHTDTQGEVPDHPLSVGEKTCVSCHNPHTAVASGGCSSCHDSPPPTASHTKHYGDTSVGARYGDTRITQGFGNYSTAYVFGCGNCHPRDTAKHVNGVVDVELYDHQAPVGSLKAMNPSTAAYVAGPEVFTDNKGLAYTKGTCTSVYCHSYNEWTTTAPIPDGDPNWQTKTVVTRNYRTVTWGGAPLTCAGCHGNPPETSYLTNDGGAGDSHSWMDSGGYQNLHTYNHGNNAPVSCRYCHVDTVTQTNTYTADSNGNWTLGAVPITNYSKHVNGSNDVSFYNQNPYVYILNRRTFSKSLEAATYDSVTRNCSNVSCHRNQTTVKWGTPFRREGNECYACHN